MSERFEEVANRYLDIILRGPKEYMCACPFCDGKSSLQFNIEKGLWTCFRCSEGGTAKKLVQRLGGVYTDPAVSTEILYKALDRLALKERRGDPEPKILEERYLLRYTGGPPHDYWTKIRKFSLDTIERWQLGYDPILDRCTIPYRDHHGSLLGIIQRRLDDNFPRYIYPEGFDRLGSLFGSWKTVNRESTHGIICEGSTDVIACSQSGFFSFGQYGSFISPRQVKLLRQLGIRELTLFYDYDEAGRKATLQARGVLDGFILRGVKWDQEKYCWHDKLCGCGDHTWQDIARCKKKTQCSCGRQHNMDPGKLSDIERTNMIESAHLVGRRKPTWHMHRSAK